MAEANLALQRPLLLTVGAYGSSVAAVVIIVLFALAPFNFGSFTIHNRAVSGQEFLRQVGVLWGTIGLISAAVSYGLFKEREWARPLMVLFWLVLGGYAVDDALSNPPSEIGILGAVLFAVGFVVAAGWYLYRRRSVVQYYAALAAERQVISEQ